jgi:pyocin large subunit-like protein
MSIFGDIMKKIFHPKSAAAPAAPQAPAATPAATPVAPPPPTVTTSTAEAAPAVDVVAVLTEMAKMKEGGNWQSSIVDLLKLLDIDSSLAARKELAEELGVHAGADGSAEQNIALHRAVMRKLAENGGVVPDSLRD